MAKLVKIYLNVRRYDFADNPELEPVEIEVDSSVDYQVLKKQLNASFNISEKEKVIKVRNLDYCLIPMGELLEGSTKDRPYIVDIVTIKYTDAHKAALNKKIESLLQRLSQVEEIAQEVQWRKQANTEETINVLTEKVEFLNRRFDQLLPMELKPQLPSTSELICDM